MKTYTIELFGFVPSKKSEKIPIVTKRGKRRMYYQSQPLIDYLIMQVPGELRDLGLTHPDIDIRMWKTDGRSDRDGALATLLDILVKMKVLINDSTARCNGRIVLFPAEKADENRTMITLRDTGIDRWQK